jgi:hypothetical protein
VPSLDRPSFLEVRFYFPNLIHISKFSIIPAAFWQGANARILLTLLAGNFGTAIGSSINTPEKQLIQCLPLESQPSLHCNFFLNLA